MSLKKVFIYVIGTSQDGGYPHLGCKEECCQMAWNNPLVKRFPSSIALVDMNVRKYWLFDITPEVKEQIHMLDAFECELAGVFITHAHIGHYMGLINFGLEVMNLNSIPVYVMPKMKDYIQKNSMFSQLIKNKNIILNSLNDNQDIIINENFSVKPFQVPHRNELSETVGFMIKGSEKSIIYLPDIDSWKNFKNALFELIKYNNLLFLDGTFYSKKEIKNRDISRIPHPEIIDTMRMLSHLKENDKKKIYFIHLNHTNDALREDSNIYDDIIKNGFLISKEKQLFNIN